MINRFLIIFLYSVSHFSIAQDVPIPQGLNANYIVTDTANYIFLNWAVKESIDEETVGYNVLVNFPPEDKLFVLGEAGLIFKNQYYYEIKTTKAAKYRFAIVGINNFPKIKRSNMSEVVEIVTPSLKLPNVEIQDLKVINEQIILKWNYPYEIPDLVGFRVYANDELLVDEKEIVREDNRLNFAYKEKGNYSFQISAVTITGVQSRLSQKVTIKIE